MNFKKLLIFFILIFLIPCVFAQTSIDEKINSIVYYAEQYEIGNIDYLQLKIYAHSIRERINLQLGGELGPERKGITKEKVEEIFGEPTEMTYWVWVENLKQDKKLDDPLPGWKKIVFDGRKIQISLNAWPYIIEKDGETFNYYFVNFEVRFKKEVEFDTGASISEVEKTALDYYSTGSGARSLVENMVNSERSINELIEQNRENCLDFMEDIFSNDKKKGEIERIRWQVYLYKGKNVDLRLDLHTCDSCEWPWVNMWVEMETKGPKQFKVETKSAEGMDREYYREWSIDDINNEIKKTISNLASKAKEFDSSMSGNFPSVLISSRIKLEAMNNILNEKYYNDEKTRKENYENRLSLLNDMLGQYGNIEKTSFKEIRFEKRIIENTIERQDSWCRHLNDVECAADEGCYQGICVPALGGNEDCENKIDDDNDNIVDCNDPDCYDKRECGKLCESTCKDTCWSCNDEECKGVCKTCWDCEREGKDCRDICETPCWSCINEKCKDRCEECWDCEDEAYGSGCRKRCKNCWECRGRGEECKTECEECIPCEEETKREECKKQCGEDEACIEECLKTESEGDEKSYQDCREACKKKYSEKECYRLCDQKVIFICGEKRQRTPCEDVISYTCEWGMQDIPCYVYDCPDGTKQTEPCEPTYICDGKPQTKPCNVYICNGMESYVPCENVTCGQSQILENNICVCLPGYYDCDEDGNCESTGKCKRDMEICNDGLDNNNDGLIDCQDLIGCKGVVCGQDEIGKDMRCFEGNCLSIKGCAKEGEQWGVGLIWECCERLKPLYVSESSGYCTFCGDGTCKSPEDVEINGKLLCPEDCKSRPVVCSNETGCNDNNPCTKDSCFEDECVYEDVIPCCGNRKCEEREDISTCSNDCLQPCPKTCCDNECPPGCEEVCPQKCGNHRCEVGEKETCPEDCYKCPIYIPPACPYGKMIFKGRDKNGCPLESVCVPVEEKECQTDEDCTGEALCGIARCMNKKCVVTDVTMCEKAECKTGERKTEICSDGSQITKAECFDFKWVETGLECPEVPGVEIVCGDNLCQRGEAETCPEDCPIKEEKRGECSLKEDCGGPQDVCSNGKCVTLPLPIEKEEQKEEVITTETTITETTVETIQEEEQEETPPAPLGDFLKRLTGLFTGEGCDDDKDCSSDQFCTRESGLREDIGKFVCADKCSSKEDCPTGMNCDEVRGVCHCARWEGHFDCDGNYDNGCEANDATCGGTYDVCDYWDWCDKQPNRYCDTKKGECLCKEGYFDCDGDWQNGCESIHECKGCQSDTDCAEDRCVEWGNIIQQFGCYKGSTWIEEKGVFQLGGGCEFYPKEGVHGNVHFDAWGDPFEELNMMRGEVEQTLGSEWCEWELENLKKERMEIQNTLNENFLKWFFEDYVTQSPSEFEVHIGGVWDVYWGGLVENSKRTAEMIACLGQDKFPSEYVPITVEYDTNYGSVKIWEERKTTDMFGTKTEIFSPYMEIWVFPSKGFMKNMFKTSMEEGVMPGPEEQPKEITPAMREEMRNNKELMDAVNSLSDKYDGEAKGLITIKDGDELVFQALITANPDIVLDFKPSPTITEETDVTVTIDFDFIYDMIMFEEKQMRGKEKGVPSWEERPGRGFKGFVDDATMFTKVMGGITTGKIKISPITEMNNVMTIMKFVMGGPGGPEEKD